LGLSRDLLPGGHILEDLAEEEFKTFKWFLNQEILKPFKAIPKSRLEKADRTDTVDEMFKSCCIYTMRVAAKGLEKIPRNDLVQNIPKTIKEPEDKSEKDDE
uniref:Pyrin domain-containing protein n=1 Tax=Stegastes partitus TaxID=144197 RepID=A0A3B5AS52_9TELE